MRLRVQLLLLFLLLAPNGCHQTQRAVPAAQSASRQAVPTRRDGIHFTDITTAAGVHFRHVNGATGMKYMPETMGSGCAFLDYDGDGRPDLFFVNSGSLPGTSAVKTGLPALYHNEGAAASGMPVFRDVTAGSGLDVPTYGMGVAVGDFDNDGRDDLYLSAALESGRLFHNEGGGRFRDVTRAAGVGDEGHWGTSAAWVDVDRDGRLDLFVCNYVRYDLTHNLVCRNRLGGRSYCTPHHYPADHCVLYHNEGSGRFTDVSRRSGVANSSAKALGVTVVDFDGDGWPDLYVASDTTPNLLLHNVPGPEGTRLFREEGLETGVAYGENGLARAGMGVDTAWLDGNRLAIAVANFSDEPLSLFVQDSPTLYTDRTYEAGLASTHLTALSFGLCFFDADNDGRADLFVNNGHVQDDIQLFQNNLRYAEPCQIFRSEGGLRFTDVSQTAGAPFRRQRVGRGAVYGDVDGDGRLDLLLTSNNGPAELLRNDTTPRRHWLQIDLVGTKSNRDGYGAEVAVLAGGRRQRQWARSGSSYCSAATRTLQFGLGDATRADRVEIRWPSGAITRLGPILANRRLRVVER